MRVALIGLPGSGKSTVGRQLARRLKLAFYDSDHVIEDKLGCSIREYFELEGEAAFRDVEQATIFEYTERDDLVLSTGGGTILRSANRARLGEKCFVIYLRSSPEELYRRLKFDSKRPLLQVADPLGRLKELYAVRHPHYSEIAHFTIDTGRPSVHTLVNLIMNQIELMN